MNLNQDRIDKINAYMAEMKPICLTLEMKLAAAITQIDNLLGPGYAQQNPVLLAACVQSLSMDEMVFGNIEDAIKEIAMAISTLNTRDDADEH